MTTATVPAPYTSAPPTAARSSLRGWGDFLLLALMSTNMAWAMQSAGWAPGLDRLYTLVLLATIAGVAVARSGFGRLFAALYQLVVGTAAILLSLSNLAPAGLTGQEQVYFLLDRAYAWIYNAYAGIPQPDNLVFVLWMAILVWILAYSAAWAYFRDQRKWQAVLPIGLAMLVNLYYGPPRLNGYFVLYLLCAILLLVRATLGEREIEWRQARVRFPLDISFDFMRDGLIFALFVIFLSWILPSAASDGQLSPMFEPLRRPWQAFQREWERLFSTVSYGRAVNVPTFGTTLGLGGPREVTDDLVLDVDTPVNRYYRGAVHDFYLPNGGGWSLTRAAGVHLEEENNFTVIAWPQRQVITQTVTTYLGDSVIVAAPQPLRVFLPADAYLIDAEPDLVQNDAQIPPKVELAMIFARDDLAEGDSYVVVSAVISATELQLRADSASYPDFIRERYLQLPETLPDRVRQRAEEVAAGGSNPYDIAKAVERHLRNYTYNDQIPGPAPGQDGVDYFLFEEQQGYCTYYASAMAVMLRHLGIPARLATGYATGEYQPATGLYRLRNKDLHTWVEVFFPSFGWVEFEPTAAEPVLLRPSGEDLDLERGLSPSGQAGNLADLEDELRDQSLGPEASSDAIGVIQSLVTRGRGVALLLAAVVGILWIGVWSLRRLRRPVGQRAPTFHSVPQGFAARLWEKLMQWARRFGLADDPSQTPLERAGALAGAVPQAASGAAALADLYTRDLFSPHPITLDDASQAQLTWMELRPLLWRNWLDRRLRLPAGLKRALFRQ